MGAITSPSPVLLLIAASSRYDEALQWGCARAEEALGAIALRSEPFEFTETDYYLREMGPDLKKQFWAFQPLVDPGLLPDIKSRTNSWETDFASLARYPQPRPLNLDPGYLTGAKLVLASTKDHAHRLYLAKGIYGELTLSYRSRQWQSLPWTYPDYQRSDYQEFFTRCRDFFLDRLRAASQ